MPAVFANNATSTLASSISDAVTTIAVAGGDASKFPSPTGGDWFPVTVTDTGGNVEMMRCTARSGANLTVTRAQEGTAAQAFAAGSRVDMRLTAAALAEILSLIAGLTSGKSPVGHGHVIADVSGLQAALDAKAASSHNHDAAAITTGVLDPARIPIIATQQQVISASATIAGLSAPEQAEVTGKGVVVATTDGRRWLYKGSGSKVLEASYIEMADVTPDWSTIANRPVNATQSVAGLMSTADKIKADRFGAGVVSITGAATLDGTHAGKLIELGGASNYTLSLTAAATLGSGWTCYLKATSAIIVTVDPNASETIEGNASLNLAKGQECWLTCDGTGFKVFGLARRILLSSQDVSGVASVSMTLPPGFAIFDFDMAGVQPALDGQNIFVHLSDDGGATFKTGGSDYNRAEMGVNAVVGVGGSWQTSSGIYAHLAAPNSAWIAISGRLYLPRDATKRTLWRASSAGSRVGWAWTAQALAGERITPEDNNAIRFMASSGNISGRFVMYGEVS